MAKKGRSHESPKSSFGDIPKGPLQIVVSIGQQHVTLYSNGTRVTQSQVSTGVPGHPTPTGVFSIIQKDRYHHSNLYSNAPMPYMQRITWSGVAMHEGPLPGHPASHGCIRLTHDFAARLWTATKLGVRVVVVRNDVAPQEFSDARLFNPEQKPPQKQASDLPSTDALRPALAGEEPSGTGGGAIVMAQAPAGTINARRSDIASQLPVLPKPVSDERVRPGILAGPVVDATMAAPARETSDEPAKPSPAITEPLKPIPPRSRTAEPTKRSGQVAVFVSRKEKKVFVRQGFEPVFDMPVEIVNPDQPLGTHVFTALEFLDGGAGMRWNVISIPGAEPRRSGSVERRKDGKKSYRAIVKEPAEVEPASTAAQALGRIKLPQEAIDRIDEILTPGSSLVVSDSGLGGETGRSTEFIVLTR